MWGIEENLYKKHLVFQLLRSGFALRNVQKCTYCFGGVSTPVAEFENIIYFGVILMLRTWLRRHVDLSPASPKERRCYVVVSKKYIIY